jgi:cobalt/nickel transport protein
MKQPTTRTAAPLLFAAALLFALSLAAPAAAHFGMVIPSEPAVMDSAKADVKLEVKFWHPFENSGMNLVKPKSFTVYGGGKAESVLDKLTEVKVGGLSAWSLDYKVARPGLYAFVMEPEPYWEPAEDKFIIHYTKAYVTAYGDDEGWSDPIEGLATEIVPRAKPDALYAGNAFEGKVLVGGKPVPNGEVEVEWYPGPDKKGQAPCEGLVTQVVLTDENGIFTFSPPVPGWWGFAALSDADYKLQESGADKDVELGAVLWLYFYEFQPAVPAK